MPRDLEAVFFLPGKFSIMKQDLEGTGHQIIIGCWLATVNWLYLAYNLGQLLGSAPHRLGWRESRTSISLKRTIEMQLTNNCIKETNQIVTGERVFQGLLETVLTKSIEPIDLRFQLTM